MDSHGTYSFHVMTVRNMRLPGDAVDDPSVAASAAVEGPLEDPGMSSDGNNGCGDWGKREAFFFFFAILVFRKWP
jgi:hypothetical protein